MPMVKIALAQMRSEKGDWPGNLRRVGELYGAGQRRQLRCYRLP